jgi:ribosome biogenesis GTPase
VSERAFDADVARIDFGGCLLLRDDGRLVEAQARGKLMGQRKALGNSVVVGDRVHAIAGEREDRATIESVAPRRNAFRRRASGTRPAEQVVAANLDQVIFVASIVAPDFKPGLADRVVAQAMHDGIHARLALTKVDLAPAADSRALLADYRAAGVDGDGVSSKTHEGIDAVHAACHGKRSLFVGHSGVGKSTLLNALAPGLELLAGEVNPKTEKGRHTTTAAWLVRPDPGTDLIDTPGVRAFGLWDVDARHLELGYPEIHPIAANCRFGDCKHEHEAGCAVRAAVAAGRVARRRYESFIKLRAELEHEEADIVERARAAARRARS